MIVAAGLGELARTPFQLLIAQDAGDDGAVMPEAAQASRKRKKVSASKKNWVMAELAPASILRFRKSTQSCIDCASGCGSG